MSVDGIQSNFSAAFAQSASQASSSEGARGAFMGHTVSVQESPASLLADAAEELGFSVDKTKDFALKERKDRDTAGVSKKMMERFLQMLQKAGKGEKLNTLVNQLKTLEERQSMEKALSALFDDPSEAWAAIEEAEKALDDDPNTTIEQKTALRELKNDYFKTHGTAIKLGIHGALEGAGYSNLGDMTETGELYRKTVGDFSNVNEVFTDIKAKYGDRFDLAMDFLFSAISNDIASDTPTMEKTHLENIHEKLGFVRLTQSAYRVCQEVMDRWHNEHHMPETGLNAMDLMGEILNLGSSKFVSSMQIDTLSQRANPPDPEKEVLFLQDLLSGVRRFPTDLFGDEQNRMSLIDAVQTSVDNAIDREDQWLASFE